MKRSPVVLLISVFLAILFSPIAKANASLIITSANTVTQDNPAAPVHIEGSWLGISPDCTQPKSDSYILLGVKVFGAPENYKGYNYNYGMPKYDKIKAAVGSNDPKNGSLKTYFSEPQEYAESSKNDFTIRISTDYNEISFNISITTEGWPPGTYPVAITGYAGSISLCGPEVTSNMTIVVPSPTPSPRVSSPIAVPSPVQSPLVSSPALPVEVDAYLACDETAFIGDSIGCFSSFSIKGENFSKVIKSGLFEVFTKVEGQKNWDLNTKFIVTVKPYSTSPNYADELRVEKEFNLKNLKMGAKPLLIKYQFTSDIKFSGTSRILPKTRFKISAPGSVYVGKSFTAKIVTNKLFKGKCSIQIRNSKISIFGGSTQISNGSGYLKLHFSNVGPYELYGTCEAKNWAMSGSNWKMYSRG